MKYRPQRDTLMWVEKRSGAWNTVGLVSPGAAVTMLPPGVRGSCLYLNTSEPSQPTVTATRPVSAIQLLWPDDEPVYGGPISSSRMFLPSLSMMKCVTPLRGSKGSWAGATNCWAA